MFKQFMFFFRSKRLLAGHLSKVFLTDAIIYFVTIGFGIFSWVGLPTADYAILYVLRLIAFAGNIWASWRLFKLYDRIGG